MAELSPAAFAALTGLATMAPAHLERRLSQRVSRVVNMWSVPWAKILESIAASSLALPWQRHRPRCWPAVVMRNRPAQQNPS